ncbi:class IV adenylate cyclase [Flavihumibacter rivuli]|uniref:class IV adenylate cyclase n=1 Tax=Flavihumibacter rivuli TaxID=2838156 RepID=UPI001BDEF92A|nr:class IV adenylate cyclase [Flavihumibacter rivuli]ULQ57480.1 class IV adenylate cyclase [Flavihumibacter rivuli]
MTFTNIEIKAKTNNLGQIRNWLQTNNAEFRGTDRQKDTYFKVPYGRLKLREGNIENNLIYYQRRETTGLKQSDFQLSPVGDSVSLKNILDSALGILIEVEKSREIYYIGNVKFHLDEVPGLGHFVEIEASNKEISLVVDDLRSQCSFYMQSFGISEQDLIAASYSDMMLNNR